MATSKIDSRVNRLIGQIEGIRRMIHSGRSTDDTVQQIMAARQALTRIGMVLLKEEMVRLAEGKSSPYKVKKTEQLIEKIFRV